MKIYDFNIHLPHLEDEDVNVVIDNDLNLTNEELVKGLETHQNKFTDLSGANFLLFNTNLFSSSISEFKAQASNHFQNFSLTALVDFRRYDLIPYLEKVKEQGVQAIMVNSYLQQISESDFPLVHKACKFAEENNLIICIDGSYGTSKMYSYDNLKLACFISDFIERTPIVIIHSGGLRILEAMLLALEKTNVWLDSSFSLPYYLGSSLEQDYAFAYKKIGTNRVLYGSDIPYLNSDKSIQLHLNFFEKYHFSDKAIENILYSNAMNLLFG